MLMKCIAFLPAMHFDIFYTYIFFGQAQACLTLETKDHTTKLHCFSRTNPSEFSLWLSGLRTQLSLCEDVGLIPGFAQWVRKAGRRQCCHGCSIGRQLQLRFDLYPGKLHMPQVCP